MINIIKNYSNLFSMCLKNEVNRGPESFQDTNNTWNTLDESFKDKIKNSSLSNEEITKLNELYEKEKDTLSADTQVEMQNLISNLGNSAIDLPSEFNLENSKLLNSMVETGVIKIQNNKIINAWINPENKWYDYTLNIDWKDYKYIRKEENGLLTIQPEEMITWESRIINVPHDNETDIMNYYAHNLDTVDFKVPRDYEDLKKENTFTVSTQDWEIIYKNNEWKEIIIEWNIIREGKNSFKWFFDAWTPLLNFPNDPIERIKLVSYYLNSTAEFNHLKPIDYNEIKHKLYYLWDTPKTQTTQVEKPEKKPIKKPKQKVDSVITTPIIEPVIIKEEQVVIEKPKKKNHPTLTQWWPIEEVIINNKPLKKDGKIEVTEVSWLIVRDEEGKPTWKKLKKWDEATIIWTTVSKSSTHTYIKVECWDKKWMIACKRGDDETNIDIVPTIEKEKPEIIEEIDKEKNESLLRENKVSWYTVQENDDVWGVNIDNERNEIVITEKELPEQAQKVLKNSISKLSETTKASLDTMLNKSKSYLLLYSLLLTETEANRSSFNEYTSWRVVFNNDKMKDWINTIFESYWKNINEIQENWLSWDEDLVNINIWKIEDLFSNIEEKLQDWSVEWKTIFGIKEIGRTDLHERDRYSEYKELFDKWWSEWEYAVMQFMTTLMGREEYINIKTGMEFWFDFPETFEKERHDGEINSAFIDKQFTFYWETFDFPNLEYQELVEDARDDFSDTDYIKTHLKNEVLEEMKDSILKKFEWDEDKLKYINLYFDNTTFMDDLGDNWSTYVTKTGLIWWAAMTWWWAWWVLLRWAASKLWAASWILSTWAEVTWNILGMQALSWTTAWVIEWASIEDSFKSSIESEKLIWTWAMMILGWAVAKMISSVAWKWSAIWNKVTWANAWSLRYNLWSVAIELWTISTSAVWILWVNNIILDWDFTPEEIVNALIIASGSRASRWVGKSVDKSWLSIKKVWDKIKMKFWNSKNKALEGELQPQQMRINSTPKKRAWNTYESTPTNNKGLPKPKESTKSPRWNTKDRPDVIHL